MNRRPHASDPEARRVGRKPDLWRPPATRRPAEVWGDPVDPDWGATGDRRYGNPRRNAQLQERYGFDGMALHASLLRLVVDGVAFEFEAPLPASWSALGALDGS